MRLPPTKRQRDCERFLKKFIAENEEMAPTYAEIACALGVSNSSAQWLVKELVRKGRATYVPHAHRTVQLVSGSTPA